MFHTVETYAPMYLHNKPMSFLCLGIEICVPMYLHRKLIHIQKRPKRTYLHTKETKRDRFAYERDQKRPN